MDPIDRDPTGPPPRRLRLGLGEAMLWVALAAVCSAALSISTALAVVAALVLAPTLARALLIVNRRKALGRPVDVTTWVVAAMGSAVAVLTTGTVIVLGGVCGMYLAGVVGGMMMGLLPGLFLPNRLATKALVPFMLTGAVTSAVVVFRRVAPQTWAIRDHEVGRALGPGGDSDPDGRIPC